MTSPPEPAEPKAGLEPFAAAAGSPPPAGRRRFALIRRALGPLLRPIADYARRYLQAPVVQRLDELERHLVAIDGSELRMSERVEILRRGVSGLHDQLVEARQAQDDQNVRRQAQYGVLLEQIQQAAALNERAFAEMVAAFGPRIDALPGILGPRFDELAGMFGPRFDELEIKARPLLAYDDESVAVRMGDGYVLAPRSEPLFTVMLADATTGGLEPGTRQVLKRLVRPGMHAADIGANIGLLTLVMARAAGADGRVYSFEPEAGPRAQLSKMKALNGLAWVDIRPVAVGREPGRLTFHVSDIIGHSSLYALPEAEERRAKLIEVEVVRLDDALGADAQLDVVKIDVEGAELDVLAGMTGLLSANKDIALIAEYGPSHLSRVGQTPADWFAAFAAHGLKPYAIAEPSGRCAPCGSRTLAGVESLNIAFVRPGGQAQRRLLGA